MQKDFLVRDIAIPSAFAIVALASVALAALATMPAASAAQSPGTLPPIFGIEMVDYQKSITQAPGTSASYEATVRNAGVMELSAVRMKSDKLPEGWLKSETVALVEFDRTAKVKYTITLPALSEGEYVFSLIAYGEHGTEGASDVVPVLMKVSKATTGPGEGSVKEANVSVNVGVNEGTSTGPETGQPATMEKDGPSIITGLMSLPSKAIEAAKSGVSGTMRAASVILSDTYLLLKVFVALLAIMLALAVLMKIVS